MTIAIDDIPATEQLDREALTTIRGGVAQLSLPASIPSPWDDGLPEFPAFPNCFPFNGSSPLPHPTGAPITPEPGKIVPL
jgi:hypothetical protein